MAGHAIFPLLLHCCLIVNAYASCQFHKDDFSTREWDLNTDHEQGSDQRQLKITDDVMTVSGWFHHRHTAVTYTCHTAIPATGEDSAKYVVTKHQDGVADINTCVQFVNRSQKIFQLKWGTEAANPANTLCNDMTLSVGLLIPIYDMKFRRVQCPLTGGFHMKAYNNASVPYCGDGLRGLRIESYCTYPGHFEFSEFPADSSHCNLPRLPSSLHFGDKLYCGATWVEGANTFFAIINIIEGSYAGVACLRYPTDHGDTFTAYLYSDGKCDNTVNNDLNKDYTRLELTKHVRDNLCDDGVAASLCEGESEACEMGDVCHKTCQFCAKQGWGNTTFPTTLRGEWIKNSLELGQQVVTITDKTITIPDLGTFNLLPVDSDYCRSKVSYYEHGDSTPYTLYETQDNGCVPRYSVILIQVQSDDVISYTISESWVRNSDYCSRQAKWVLLHSELKLNKYDTNHQFQGNRGWTRRDRGWSNLVKTNPKPASCPTDANLFQSYELILPASGETCQVEFYGSGTQKIKLTSKACTKNGATVDKDLNTEFTCLASFKKPVFDDKHLYAIVSVPATSPIGTLYGQYICIVFSFQSYGDSYYDTDVFYKDAYWLPISSCTVPILVELINGEVPGKQPYAQMNPSGGSSVSYCNVAQLLVLMFASLVIIDAF